MNEHCRFLNYYEVKNKWEREVQQLDRHTLKVIKEYPSIAAASRVTSGGNISMVCQGKRPAAGGFKWRYLDE